MIVGTALSATAVLVTNTILLRYLASSQLNLLMGLRTVFISALVLSTLPLAGAVANERPSRLWEAAIVAAVILRLTLWFGTHLVYGYSLTPTGLPRYGPLLVPTSLIVLALLFGYLTRVAMLGRTELERIVLAAGILGSAALGVVSVVSSSGLVAELLTGYLTLPSLVALAVLVRMRQDEARRAVGEYSSRQHALADLSRLALTAPLSEVRESVQASLVAHLPHVLAEQAMVALDDPRRPEPEWFDDPKELRDEEFVTSVRNVLSAASERERATAELWHRANHDDLTALANRRRVRTVITTALERSDPAVVRKVAVAFCNLDRFKTVNDAYGHGTGDEVLRVVAHRFRVGLRDCDDVGRFGSDEFVVCSSLSGDDTVDALVDRIHDVFRIPVMVGTTEARLTATVGVAACSPGALGSDCDAMLRDAITAMHDAKRRGLPTGQFRHEMRADVVRRADLEQQLAAALRRGDIVAHYQPIVDLETCEVVGFEALARWRQGTSFIPAATWISVAEATEIVDEMGAQLLVSAARQTAKWRSDGHEVGINVNVSARQLGGTRLETAVTSALEIVPRGAFCLELTESLALNETAQDTIKALDLLGVRLALDDFGTGYSALAAVAQLPISQIKIDRSITGRIASKQGRALISATLAIAASLGLTVVAEGVESPAQHWDLLDLGCQLAQGYLYSYPLEAQQASELLKRGVRFPDIRLDGAPTSSDGS